MPLINVPLALPKSLIQNASPRRRISACSREANGSSTQRSLRAERPIVVRNLLNSTTESPCDGVERTIKRGIRDQDGKARMRARGRVGADMLFHPLSSPFFLFRFYSKLLFKLP